MKWSKTARLNSQPMRDFPLTGRGAQEVLVGTDRILTKKTSTKTAVTGRVQALRVS